MLYPGILRFFHMIKVTCSMMKSGLYFLMKHLKKPQLKSKALPGGKRRGSKVKSTRHKRREERRNDGRGLWS